MKMKLLGVTIAMVMLFSVSAFAAAYDADAFKTAYDALEDDAAIIELCRDYMTNAEDIDVVRNAQSSWESADPEGAIAFAKKMADANPSSAKYTYLLGRVSESSVDKIKLGRKAIEIDANWPYGYRLVLATYMNDVFNGDDEEIAEMLKADGALFSKLVEIDAGAEYALNFLFSYQTYVGDYDAALATLAIGKKAEASFAGVEGHSVVYAGLGRFADAKAAIEADVDARIAKGFPADRRGEFVHQYYISALADAGAHEEVINYIKSKEGYDGDAHMLYAMTCSYSRMGKADAAFATMEKACKAGWDQAAHTSSDSDLNNLHNDARWEMVMASVQSNWDAGADDRKAEALAGKMLKDSPMWSLENADGEIVNLADFNGKVVVLDFWATWCGPCRMAMPVINEFVREHAASDVVVFSVNVWEKGKKKPAKYMTDNDYAMRLVYGNNELAASYGVRGIPHLCVIDKNGKIRFEESGYSPQLLENLIWWTEDLLSES